jgi:hypothetical protein
LEEIEMDKQTYIQLDRIEGKIDILVKKLCPELFEEEKKEEE